MGGLRRQIEAGRGVSSTLRGAEKVSKPALPWLVAMPLAPRPPNGQFSGTPTCMHHVVEAGPSELVPANRGLLGRAGFG